MRFSELSNIGITSIDSIINVLGESIDSLSNGCLDERLECFDYVFMIIRLCITSLIGLFVLQFLLGLVNNLLVVGKCLLVLGSDDGLE